MRRYEYFDAARDARGTVNKSAALEGENHLVDRWRGDCEVALDVGLGRRTGVYTRIGVNEGQVLALREGEGWRGRADRHRSGFEIVCAHEHTLPRETER